MNHLQERFKKYFEERAEREEREKNSQSEATKATKLEHVGSLILDLLEALPDTIFGFSLFKNINGTFTIRPFVFEERRLAGDDYYKKCDKIQKAVENIPKAKQSMDALNYIEYEEVILYQIKDIILKAKNPKEIKLDVNLLYVIF